MKSNWFSCTSGHVTCFQTKCGKLLVEVTRPRPSDVEALAFALRGHHLSQPCGPVSRWPSAGGNGAARPEKTPPPTADEISRRRIRCFSPPHNGQSFHFPRISTSIQMVFNTVGLTADESDRRVSRGWSHIELGSVVMVRKNTTAECPTGP